MYTHLNDFLERFRNSVFLNLLLTLKLENQDFSQRLCFQSFASCSQVSPLRLYLIMQYLVTFTGSSGVLM